MTLRIRRGGSSAATPTGTIFGPTAGAASVRSGAGARTVTNPGGGISFNSSNSLQSAINSNPQSSTFVCSSNTPVWNSAVDTGTKAPTIVFPGAVGSVVINGGGAQFLPISLGLNATLKGGTWTNFGTTTVVHGINVNGDNCLVEDVVVSDMWNDGIKVLGNSCTISHCTIHSNGVEGYSGQGDDYTLEYCEVYGNNANLNSPGNEGGAGKILFAIGGNFHHNWVHDNIGFGAWWDTGNYNWIIEENVMESNDRSGFFYEASYGSVIRNNYIADNGVSTVIGTQAASFENCANARLSDSDCNLGAGTRGSFTRNIIDHTGTQSGTLGGLLLLWHHAGGSGTSTNRTQRNWDFTQNQFWLRNSTQTQRVGGEESASVETDVWDASNVFSGNEYHVANMATSYWKWDVTGGGGVAKTWAQWQAFHTGETTARVQI